MTFVSHLDKERVLFEKATSRNKRPLFHIDFKKRKEINLEYLERSFFNSKINLIYTDRQNHELSKVA